MGGGVYGHKAGFQIAVGEILSETGAARLVDVWAAERWLTCDDNHVYVPQFAWDLQHSLGSLLRDPQWRRGRPYPELSVADNYRRLRADAETDNTQFFDYMFMDWEPTADNVSMLLFQEGGTAYLPFSFWRPHHHAPSELGKVFVAELPEWELATVLHIAAWAIIWDWANRSQGGANGTGLSTGD